MASTGSYVGNLYKVFKAAPRAGTDETEVRVMHTYCYECNEPFIDIFNGTCSRCHQMLCDACIKSDVHRCYQGYWEVILSYSEAKSLQKILHNIDMICIDTSPTSSVNEDQLKILSYLKRSLPTDDRTDTVE